MSWTDKRIQRLITLWNEGKEASLIAKELKTTRNAIIGKVHRLRKRGVKLTARTTTLNHRPGSQKTRVVNFRPKQVGTSNALFDHQSNQCHWPIGDPYSRDFSFCRHHKASSSNYCAEHAHKAHDRSSDVSVYVKAA